MDFTREPIIETVITPKEGFKLAVRSSKNAAQEEFFVDAVEVISFGNAIFFRSIERPKAFLVPASDYEVLEVREARVVLKNIGIERSIKIGGGKLPKETIEKVVEQPLPPPEPVAPAPVEAAADSRLDKRRDRRRSRRRRGREEGGSEELEVENKVVSNVVEEEKIGPVVNTPSMMSPLLPPPSTLISETIASYRHNALYKEAFYKTAADELKEQSEEENIPSLEESIPSLLSEEPGLVSEQHPDDLLEALAMQDISLEPSEFGSFGFIEEIQEAELKPGEHDQSSQGHILDNE